MKDIVPAENLLIYNVKDGWEPLCEFLGKTVPLDGKGDAVPFPRGNDPGIFRKRFRDAIWYNFLELGERVLKVVVVLYFGYLWVGGIWGWVHANMSSLV